MKVDVYCPTCDQNTPHKVLRSNGRWLVRCTKCSTTHKIDNPLKDDVGKVNVRVVVSKEGNSYVSHTEFNRDDVLLIGEELIIDSCGFDEVNLVEITALEEKYGRTKQARAEEIETIWARAIDEVTLKVSMNMGQVTKSYHFPIEGNRLFVVGEKYTVGQVSFVINKIKCRSGKFLGRRGQEARACTIKRVFAEPAESTGKPRIRNPTRR